MFRLKLVRSRRCCGVHSNGRSIISIAGSFALGSSQDRHRTKSAIVADMSCQKARSEEYKCYTVTEAIANRSQILSLLSSTSISKTPFRGESKGVCKTITLILVP